MTAAVTLVAPSNFPRLDSVQIAWPFLAVGVVTSVFVGVCAATIPAYRSARLDLATAMSAGGGRGVSAPASRARRLLLIVEATLAVVLIVGAMLMARSFVRLVEVDPGYDRVNVLSANLIPPSGMDGSRLAEAMTERVRELPGVQAAGAGSMAPFGNMVVSTGFELPGVVTSEGRPVLAHATMAVITTGYAEALGLRLREGRFFRQSDVGASIRPMLVNDAFVRRYLADGRGATGRRFRGIFGENDRVVEIVGVVADVLPAGPGAEPQPQIYTLHGNPLPMGNATLVVKTRTDPSAMVPRLRQIVHQIEPGASLDEARPLGSKMSAAVSGPRFTMLVLTAFAALSLSLAATGLYGVLSYTVAQRRREMAIRIALGATRVRLAAMVLRDGLVVTAVGLLLGLIVAVLGTPAVSSLLFGVAPLDPVAFSLAPLLLLAVAIFACLGPAWRAGSTDPAGALSSQ